ncbi:hypothetical protein HY491_04680 [Candidatus Woesearchaeota archaeon]|nr:hypothetical protein [Candidatus Woesearchaeota archaeon]
MDIRSGNGWPAAALSNFAPHAFVFRGVAAASMEGLLQSFKEKNSQRQEFVCTLVGKKAKFTGKKKKWWRTQTLWWQGKPIDRHSDEYQQMLDEAFLAMFTQNERASHALLATGNAVLTHRLGKADQSQTVLTRQEFVSRLTSIRAQLSAR